MNMSDPIADMLTRIRNAGKAKLPQTTMPASAMKAAVAQVLKDSGYILDWSVEGEVKKTLTITLKYVQTGGRGRDFVIEGIRRVSKPSCRVYAAAREIPRVLGGLGITILSTSQGLLTGREARKRNIGGEILCEVW